MVSKETEIEILYHLSQTEQFKYYISLLKEIREKSIMVNKRTLNPNVAIRVLGVVDGLDTAINLVDSITKRKNKCQ